jgi:hypothetical protein
MNNIEVNKPGLSTEPVEGDKPIDLDAMKASIRAKMAELTKAAEEHRANLPPKVQAYWEKMQEEVRLFAAEKEAIMQKRAARKARKSGLTYKEGCQRFLKEVDRLIEEEGLTYQEARQVASPMRFSGRTATAPTARPSQRLGSW